MTMIHIRKVNTFEANAKIEVLSKEKQTIKKGISGHIEKYNNGNKKSTGRAQ